MQFLNGKPLKLRKSVSYDSDGTIQITIFGDLVDQIENRSLSFTDVDVSKVNHQSLLKTTDITTITRLEMT